MGQKNFLDRNPVLWRSVVVAGVAVSIFLVFLSPTELPASSFTEHYQVLFVLLSLGLIFRETLPFLSSFLYGAGFPAFLDEFFQAHPFDLGTWRVAVSQPFSLLLLLGLKFMARRRGITSLKELGKEIVRF